MNENLVLIAEDDRDVRELLSFAVEAAGYPTVCVRDGRAAVTILNTTHPIALITDVRMPDMNGMELCRFARDIGDSQIAILMVSASVHPHDIDAGLSAGADRYLPKPISLRRLVAEMQEVIAHRSTTSSRHRPPSGWWPSTGPRQAGPHALMTAGGPGSVVARRAGMEVRVTSRFVSPVREPGRGRVECVSAVAVPGQVADLGSVGVWGGSHRAGGV
jgi:two-component system OmpR family response regulator